MSTMNREVVILSSSPRAPPAHKKEDDFLPGLISRDVNSPSAPEKPPIPVTPQKSRQRDTIWDVPLSSSPLKSPNELLRSLAAIPWNARKSSGIGLGKGFRTARDMLDDSGRESGHSAKEKLKENNEGLPGASGKKQGKSKAAVRKTATVKQSKAEPKKAAARTVKRTTKVSEHFSKKNKSMSESSKSKSISPIDATDARNPLLAQANTTNISKEQSPVLEKSTALEESLPAWMAPPRKRDWTPVKNSITPIVLESSPTVQDGGQVRDKEIAALDNSVSNFADTLEAFRCSTESNKPDIENGKMGSVAPILGTTKRAIEMLEKPKGSRTLSTLAAPQKSKKRLQSITNFATAKYRTADGANATETSADPSTTTAEPIEKVRAPRKSKDRTTASGATKRKRVTKVVKEDEPEVILLSPGSAIKRANGQEVVFGSFSQLTKDSDGEKPVDDGYGDTATPIELEPLYPEAYCSGSPRFGGLAIARQSVNPNHVVDEEFEALEELLESDSELGTPDIKRVKKRKKGLWHAASRDLNGGLLAVEVLDLSKTPKPIQMPMDVDCAMSYQVPKLDESINNIPFDEFVDIDQARSFDTPTSSPTRRKVDSDLESLHDHSYKARSPFNGAIGNQRDQSTPDASIHNHSTSNPIVETIEPEKPKPPDFGGYTTAQLAHQISKYGFKPIKKREAMISLLQRCWDSQQQQKIQATTRAIHTSQVMKITKLPAKRKGKSKQSPLNEDLPGSPPSPTGSDADGGLNADVSVRRKKLKDSDTAMPAAVDQSQAKKRSRKKIANDMEGQDLPLMARAGKEKASGLPTSPMRKSKGKSASETEDDESSPISKARGKKKESILPAPSVRKKSKGKTTNETEKEDFPLMSLGRRKEKVSALQASSTRKSKGKATSETEEEDFSRMSSAGRKEKVSALRAPSTRKSKGKATSETEEEDFSRMSSAGRKEKVSALRAPSTRKSKGKATSETEEEDFSRMSSAGRKEKVSALRAPSTRKSKGKATSETEEEDFSRMSSAGRKEKVSALRASSTRKSKGKATSETEEEDSSRMSPAGRKKRVSALRASTRKSRGKTTSDTDDDGPRRRRASNSTVSPTRKKRSSSRSRSPRPLGYPPRIRVSPEVDSIHELISRAVRAEYATTGDVTSSWHYKILLYEPIIIEDFTAWLNVKGLTLVGMDDEISPQLVKDWAEQRSVINVWKETHKGTKRVRF